MCIAILAKKGTRVPTDELKESFTSNPDGGGFAYINSQNQIVTFKAMKYKDFIAEYESVFESGETLESDMLIHFRIGTSGKKDLNNCHPFIVADEYAMIHNGVISSYTDRKSDFSDTYHFNAALSAIIAEHRNLLYVDDFRNMLQNVIGSSKLVFLDVRNKDGFIINEKAGHWNTDKTIWYSNYSYTCTNYTSYTANSWPAASTYKSDTKSIKLGTKFNVPMDIVAGHNSLLSQNVATITGITVYQAIETQPGFKYIEALPEKLLRSFQIQCVGVGSPTPQYHHVFITDKMILVESNGNDVNKIFANEYLWEYDEQMLDLALDYPDIHTLCVKLLGAFMPGYELAADISIAKV